MSGYLKLECKRALVTGGSKGVVRRCEWHKALDQNLFAAVRLDRALLPLMIAQGSIANELQA